MNSAIMQEEPSELRCSFCHKSQYVVRRLIAAPTVFICDECVGACVDILDEDTKPDELENSPSDPALLPRRQDASISARKLTAAESGTLIDALNSEVSRQFEEAGVSSDAMNEIKAYRETIACESIQDLSNYFVLIGRLKERFRAKT